ncbi:MAG: hypothetical protein JF621_25860 [Streptomyces turgidiscabies]|nr:hypothetical protein [Streptomyces turgidiscabies]
MATLPAHRMSQAGQDWLLTCAVDAATVRRTWDAGGLAEFPNRGVAWWLLPPGLTDELDDIHRLTVRPAGWVLTCPPVLHSVAGRWWLERPDGTGRLTNPALLGAALSAAGAQLPTEATR